MTPRPLDILDLQGYDVHMNLVLDKAEEEVDGAAQKLGTLIVRGDNVIYITPSVE